MDWNKKKIIEDVISKIISFPEFGNSSKLLIEISNFYSLLISFSVTLFKE